MEFKPSVIKVEKALIGEINYIHKIIKKKIQKDAFETISIGVQPLDIKRLSNGAFVLSNSKSVTLFDESFNQLKKVDISSRGCAIHNDKGIYITGDENHCIYLMDNELNIIKTFGSEGDGMDQFFYPCSICCQNDYLFVSDNLNKRIQIFTLDLKYHDTIRLDFYPQSIALSNTTIGIHKSDYSNNEKKDEKIYFYDLKTKTLKKEYPNISGRISLIDSHFYVLTCEPPKKLFIFDQEGELIDEASVESISKYIKGFWDGFMFLTKDNLFVTSFNGENILKFKH